MPGNRLEVYRIRHCRRTLAYMHFSGPLIREQLAAAARDKTRVGGHTHNFYRYPARFSPRFASTAIQCFSDQGGVVLDPYMGGGTTVIEAMVSRRRAIGSDINELSVFVVQAKVSALSDTDIELLHDWADKVVPWLTCRQRASHYTGTPRNMTFSATRWLRKTISQLLESIDDTMSSMKARQFARCVILNVGQWALNGRKQIPTVSEFRARIVLTTTEMIDCAKEFKRLSGECDAPILRQNDAEVIHKDLSIAGAGPVDLVVTSPPYPGIHMLYHRWQVDGRKETDAPYWIAKCKDGAGSSFYNFSDRRRTAEDRYFEKATGAFASIRKVMKKGAVLVQMIAFSSPRRQMRKYLGMLEAAGFSELRDRHARRIWRDVPWRKWHAQSKGKTYSAREVVLVHEAK